MRSFIKHFSILVLLLTVSLAEAHEGHEHGTANPSIRTWTRSDTGSHFHGSYVASSDGQVQIRSSNGKIVSVEIAKLSPSDRSWIEKKVAQVKTINETVIPSDSFIRLVSTSMPRKVTIEDTFEPFAQLKEVKYRKDDKFFYVESNSMPKHKMMVGITAWQQQVPIPQPYFGNNVWRIPLEPVPAENPMSAKSHFFRGAIALAANGVPIFNPIKNDGRTDTFLAGELDEFGGHCGRADDYHYHIAPTHLQEILGKGIPVAYALDGYAIYGYTEPDGSKVEGLDEFNGHSSPELGYHYHATKTYPYLNGGFHGQVVERDGQVDPQPRTGGVREALPPLRGAKITGFETKDNKNFSLKIEIGRETRYVNYTLNENGSVKFDFVDGSGNVRTETYEPRQRGPAAGGEPRGGREGSPRGPGGAQRGPQGGTRTPAAGQRPPRNGPEETAGDGDKMPPDANRGRGRQGDNRSPDGANARPQNGRPEDRQASDNAASTPPLIINPPKSGKLKLTSPALVEGEPLPNEFNGNGEGATPPLRWTGAPEGTKSFAIVMDHIDRNNIVKTYWNLYGIPANTSKLEKNTKGIGTLGATWKRDQAYVPPHSSGGGKQTYTIHLYALSTNPRFDDQEKPVTREVLLTAIQDKILDSSEINVTYQRPASESATSGNIGGGRAATETSTGGGRRGGEMPEMQEGTQDNQKPQPNRGGQPTRQGANSDDTAEKAQGQRRGPQPGTAQKEEKPNSATESTRGRGRGGSGLGNYTEPPPANNIPDHLYNVILGRPTDSSITIRVLFHKAASVHIQYGAEPGKLTQTTPAISIKEKGTHDFILESLTRNTRYYYTVVYHLDSAAAQESDEYTFHTQREPGSAFTFSVTSDSHLDENTSGEVYLRTLANALSASPDFHFELGDSFMTGKYVKPEISEPQYLAQRYYLGSLCHSAPLFFALGNHDGESGSRGSMLWATQTRTRLFPNPQPNRFYTGNEQSEPQIGLPENYYQWKWGNAQFIVLDPFRYTTQRSRDGNNWSWTLGEKQYRWLKDSLENVDAKFRFVFLHHLVGGSPSNNRGGVEVAKFWEWGGKGSDGQNEFTKNRPNWEMPIHDLLVKHGVSIVFHGHDHLFVKQDLDGIVYQEVPQPGHPRSGNTNTATEYGYLSGETQSSSGYIRVQVQEDMVRADYVRTYLPTAEGTNKKNGDVSFSYTISRK